MLSRLRIRQKLSLLLMIPLIAVIVTLVPFTAERIDDARSSGSTATSARSAREVGALIQHLQQERLLALGFLSAPALDRSALIGQAQLAVDVTASLRSRPETRAVLEAAAGPLAIVAAIRDRVLTRSVTSGEVYDAYRTVNTALLEALALADPIGVDALGYRQLAALDALMRANEEASGTGAVLVAAAGDRSMNRSLLTDTAIAQRLHTERFRRLVTAEQAKLVDDVEQGKAGQRLNALVADLNRTGEVPSDRPAVKVSDSLTAAVAYTGLRRLAQDRIAREIAERWPPGPGGQDPAGAVGGSAALLLTWSSPSASPSAGPSPPAAAVDPRRGHGRQLAGTELVRVADSDDPDPAPPSWPRSTSTVDDEIGELAVALNRVQATAALLLERQVTRGATWPSCSPTSPGVPRTWSDASSPSRGPRTQRTQRNAGRGSSGWTTWRPACTAAPTACWSSPAPTTRASPVSRPTHGCLRSSLAEIEGFRAIEMGNIPRSRSPRASWPTCGCSWPNCWRTRRASPRPATGEGLRHPSDECGSRRRPWPRHVRRRLGRRTSDWSSGNGSTWRRPPRWACSWSDGWPAGMAWPCGWSPRRAAAVSPPS